MSQQVLHSFKRRLGKLFSLFGSVFPVQSFLTQYFPQKLTDWPKRSLFPDFLYAVTMPMDKNFPYTQPTRRWRVLRCHEFQWYTKTLKVDNYRSLSTVRLHGADPVHDFQENLLYVFEQRIKKYSFIASSPIFKPTVQLSVTEVHSCRFLHFPMLPINLVDQCLMGKRKEPEHALAKTLFREISRV